MLAERDAISFLATKSPKRAREFYENTLGLDFLADEPFALVFRLHNGTMRIAKLGDFDPAPYTVLGWESRDSESDVARLKEKGVDFERYPGMEQDALGIWHIPNTVKVAWFKDPDGNTLSLSQHG
ncbi:MAG: VOC family protein [Cellvibrionaceae bacterium]